jgi:hypothetical protein
MKTPKLSPFAHGFGRGIKGKITTKRSSIHTPPNPKEKGLKTTTRKSPRKGSENHQKGETRTTTQDLEELLTLTSIAPGLYPWQWRQKACWHSLLVFIKCNKNFKDSRVSLFIFSIGKQRVETMINLNHVSTNLINQLD